MNAINTTIDVCPSELFQRFVKFVENERPNDEGQLTIHSIRTAARRDRLVEISSWTFEDLDVIEQECARFASDTDLQDLLP